MLIALQGTISETRSMDMKGEAKVIEPLTNFWPMS
jgi:hypothetical protein